MTGSAISLGPFDLLEPVGEGSASTVWRAVHRALEAPVAVKVFAQGSVLDPALRAAFRAEVRAVAALDHPHIVRVYDYGDVPWAVERRTEGRLRARAPWLAMEYAPGGALSRWLGRLRWALLREALAMVLRALAHAHARGVVHRDLKPGNVLLGGARPGPKLADFGIARRDDDDEEACIVGTPSYMAPEQVSGRWRDQGPWTDLYALGCTGWALASGAAPFGRLGSAREAERVVRTEPPPLQARVRVPADFEGWLRWLLQKDPARRPRDAAEALAALDALAGAMGEGAEPEAEVGFLEGAPATAGPSIGPGLRLFALRPRPLVGRAVEEARLKAALARVSAGGGARMIVLRGPTGCGKSRLAEWMCTRAAERGQALALRAVHGQGATDGLAAMLARHFRCDGLDREGVRRRLARALPGVLDDLALDALAGELSTGVRFSSAGERHACYARVLGALAAARPVIAWLDDAHDGDDALAFAEAMLGKDARVLFVATVREEALATRTDAAARLATLAARPEVETAPVGPVAPEHRRALVDGILRMEPALAARVAARTQGNPLFAVHLVGDWVQRRVLQPGADGWRLAPGEADALPDDLHAMWSETLADLLAGRPASDGPALEVAAALGQEVDAAEWRDACVRAGVGPAEGLVEALFERRLAKAEGAGWSFVHGMLRESVERRAHEGGRWGRWNAACADLLAVREGSRGVAARRVRHLLAAEAPGAAVDGVGRALDELLQACEFAQARALLAAWDAAAEPLAGEEADRLRAALRLARARVLDAVDDPASDAIVEPLEIEARLRGWVAIAAGACLLRANAVRRRGEARLGALLFENAAHEFASLGVRRWEGQARYHLAGLLMETGRLDEAQAALEEARASFEVVGHAGGVAGCTHALAHIWMMRGRLDGARPGLEAAQAEFRRLGMRTRLATAHEALGDVARYLGELDRAEACYREAMATYAAMEADARWWTPRYNLGLVLLQRGRTEEARPLLEEALAIAGEKRGARAIVLVTRLACLAGGADDGAWAESLAEARKLLAETRRREPDMGLAAELTAQAALHAGRRDRARDALRIARDQWAGLGRDAEAKAVDELLEALA